MTNHWFRFYVEALDDPKVQRLSPAMFKSWVNLLCIASRFEGRLPPVSDLRFMLRLSPSDLTQTLTTLAASGLLDKSEHGLEPHNWRGRQYKSDVSTGRVKRFRERSKPVTGNGTVTPPDTDTDTDTDTPSLRSGVARARDEAPESGCRVEFSMTFWPAYPHKVGQRKAIASFIAARQRADLATIMAGVKLYAATKPDDRQWLNPANFLDEDRWNDAPAPIASGNGKTPIHDRLTAEIMRQAREPLVIDGEENRNGGYLEHKS